MWTRRRSKSILEYALSSYLSVILEMRKRDFLDKSLLALCKFVWMIKQMTKVTYKPNLELGTILLNSERSLSYHLVFNNEFSLTNQWLGFVVFGGFYNFSGKEGDRHLGLWIQTS